MEPDAWRTRGGRPVTECEEPYDVAARRWEREAAEAAAWVRGESLPGMAEQTPKAQGRLPL